MLCFNTNLVYFRSGADQMCISFMHVDFGMFLNYCELRNIIFEFVLALSAQFHNVMITFVLMSISILIVFLKHNQVFGLHTFKYHLSTQLLCRCFIYIMFQNDVD